MSGCLSLMEDTPDSRMASSDSAALQCPEYVNPADFFLSLLSPQQNAETVKQICESYVPFDDLPELAAAPGTHTALI